jgi:aspartyl-tRNA synthetase
MKIKTSEITSYIGQTITMHLTMEALRDQKHLQFIIGSDKSGKLQLVVQKSKVEQHAEISELLEGSTFSVTGLIVEAKQSKTFGVEMQVDSIVIHSKSLPRPIMEDSSIDLRFDYRVVDLKHPKRQLMLQLRSAFEAGCREYLLQREFTEIHTPKLMAQASESGSQVFEVKYFDKKAYLSQSPQFYKQLSIASGLEAIFEIGPVFRAEESHSTRHMTEFTGFDVEFAWCFETADVMKLEEEILTYAFSKLEPFKEKVMELYGIELMTKPSVQYLTLAEAKEILADELKLSVGQDLPDEGERLLYEKLGKDLIFVSDYPIGKRPFYHMRESEKGTTKSFDLIFKGIEITTGAIREHRIDILEQQAIEKGIQPESIHHYLDSFKYGCPPHGGFGLGIERVITKLLGLGSVKEVSFVPRDPDRLTP